MEKIRFTKSVRVAIGAVMELARGELIFKSVGREQYEKAIPPFWASNFIFFSEIYISPVVLQNVVQGHRGHRGFARKMRFWCGGCHVASVYMCGTRAVRETDTDDLHLQETREMDDVSWVVENIIYASEPEVPFCDWPVIEPRPTSPLFIS